VALAVAPRRKKGSSSGGSGGTPTVKGFPASAGQIGNMQIFLNMARSMGASAEQMAGGIATMMQESSCENLQGGDRDSAGLFQQRPSQGWGSYAEVTDPEKACRKFLVKYMNYCRQGLPVIEASDKVQGSAFPQAPAQWLAESRRDVRLLAGGKNFSETIKLGGAGKSSTRIQPYEFSRGTANQPEDSWTCMGRLAEEVHWERFMRGGVLWFVSDEYLKRQTPRFNFTEGAQGVLKITHIEDARQPAAECTVTALALRWQVLPGDAVTVTGEGAADGLWLVYEVKRTITAAETEIVLRRPTQKLPEPAASKSVSVGKLSVNRLGGGGTGGATSGPAGARALYAACQKINDEHWPYVYGGGHGSCGHASTGTEPGVGFDCSSSVCYALGLAGLGFHIGGPVEASGGLESYAQPGPGKYMTVWANAGHVWLQLKGIGRAQRFDTVGGAPGEGPRLRYEMTSETTSGFTPRHWPGL
jgi:hypothetical protein